MLQLLKHRNKLHVGDAIMKSSMMKPYNNPWPYISEPDSNPLHQSVATQLLMLLM